MKRFVFASVAIIAVMAITLGLYAQPAGGGGGGGGFGNFGGGGGGGFGGGGFGGGGMMGGRGRGMRGMTPRPDKAQRIKDITTLEDQIKTLKAAIEKAPEKDPNIATLEGDALTKFMDVYTPEQEAINNIQTTLATMSGRGTAGGGRGGFGGPQEDVLSELRTLANGEKATKTVARLDALIKEAQQRATRRGGRGGGGRGGAGGMGGGGFGGGGAGGMGGGGRGGRGGRGGAGAGGGGA